MVRGKSGRMKIAMKAKKMVTAPSIMKSQRLGFVLV